jgi:cobalt-zinc-cadmium efflux system protein
MGHAYVHSAGSRNSRRLTVVLGLTTSYLVAEIVGGIVTGSLALLADAGHMFTDVAGLGLALTGIKLAERPASPSRTYGYYRVEILAAALNALLLFGVSFYVLYEAYQRFRAPPEVSSCAMLVVAVVGLAVNLVGVFLLRDAAKESLNMKGAYFEVLSDLVTSLGVIVGAVIMLTTQWYYADPLISAGIGLFILPRTWLLLRDAVNVLLEGTPSELSIASVRGAMQDVPGVATVHDLHAWSLTSGVNALSAHIVVRDGADHAVVRRAVQARLMADFDVQHVTLQMEQAGEEECESHL